MIVCGLKLTHDGAVALIEDNKLVFSIEMEKLNNNKRYTSIEDTETIAEILKQYGYKASDVDYYAIDGWGGYNADELAIQPRLEIGEEHNWLSAYYQGDKYALGIGQYHERSLGHQVLEAWKFNGLKMEGGTFEYFSYLHVAGHIMSAYCTSPFAQKGESAYILVWDGGMYPRLYFFDAASQSVENLGPIFLLIGNMYTIFSQHFGPFKVETSFAKDNLSIAGKVMAYIALGELKRELLPVFDTIYTECYNTPMGFANIFANECKKRIAGQGYKDEDILATFHVYLEELLVDKLSKKIKRSGQKADNLCIAGGCALNIKWNSAIRNAGLVKSVYVPPFPNDSGSAIGAACCAMFQITQNQRLEWSVYSGPKIETNDPDDGWTSRPVTLEELAVILHETNQPVVFLHDRAELGPRALGNRSILCAPVSPEGKDLLNEMKMRESYRPVSPICLEERAQEIFQPGTADPYMLYDHHVREGWHDKIPAVVHLDGTARLQTITREENSVVAELLEAYEKVSGIPLLCNTSANFNGSGFFPDVYAATKWGRANYVWCNHVLYEKNVEKE